jgi:putative aminopeptidase FrvX
MHIKLVDQIPDHPALNLFTELLAVPSPCGREERLAQVICQKLEAWGYTPQVDAAGNVLVRVQGRRPDAPLCCLAAHMDEIGMVVTRIEADGSLRVDRSGGLHPWKIGEGPVEVVGDEGMIAGVLSFGSGHAPSAAVSLSTRAIAWADARVITGLSPEKLKAAGIRPGSTAVPVREVCGPVLFGEADDPLVGAWTFDDRMGVVALLRLLQEMQRCSLQPHHPTIVAFTVHEEGGGHGAKALAHRERPETFIAVDGCPIPPGVPLQLDGRPGVWSKDRLAHYDQRMVRDLCQAAVAAGTELQPAVYDSTASDASMVYAAGGAQRVGCVGHVRESSHGYEVARLSVFDNLFKTLVAFAAGWEG